jgi:hypothetical protein
LRHVLGQPGLLHRVLAVGRKPFDGDDAGAGQVPIGTEQERIALPLMWTVQAPHCAIPQPNFVPVSPTASRNAQSRGVSGSRSMSCCVPLTVSVIIGALLRLQAGPYGSDGFRLVGASGGPGTHSGAIKSGSAENNQKVQKNQNGYAPGKL